VQLHKVGNNRLWKEEYPGTDRGRCARRLVHATARRTGRYRRVWEARYPSRRIGSREELRIRLFSGQSSTFLFRLRCYSVYLTSWHLQGFHSRGVSTFTCNHSGHACPVLSTGNHFVTETQGPVTVCLPRVPGRGTVTAREQRHHPFQCQTHNSANGANELSISDGFNFSDFGTARSRFQQMGVWLGRPCFHAMDLCKSLSFRWSSSTEFSFVWHRMCRRLSPMLRQTCRHGKNRFRVFPRAIFHVVGGLSSRRLYELDPWECWLRCSSWIHTQILQFRISDRPSLHRPKPGRHRDQEENENPTEEGDRRPDALTLWF
jgi:hypothetical protein